MSINKNQITTVLILGFIGCLIFLLFGGESSTTTQNQIAQNTQTTSLSPKKGEIGSGFQEEVESSSENPPIAKREIKDTIITLYVIPQMDDTWFFRDPGQSCKWVYNSKDGGFLPKSQEDRKAAYECDRKENCGDFEGSCDTNAAGKIPVPFADVACAPSYDFGTKFLIADKIYTCNDRGKAIKDPDSDTIRLDVLVDKDTWNKSIQEISTIKSIEILK